MLKLSRFSPELQDSMDYNFNLLYPTLPPPKILCYDVTAVEKNLKKHLELLANIPHASVGTLTLSDYNNSKQTGSTFNAITPVAKTRDAERSILFYSGGIESTLCAMSAYMQDIVYLEGIKELTSKYSIHLIEALLVIIAKHLGYSSCTIGSTQPGPQDASGKLYEYGPSAMWSWARSLNIALHLPFYTQSKLDVQRIISSLGLKYHSCDHDPNYCGKCFSCFQSAVLRRITEAKPFVEIDKDCLKRYVNEINHTRETGEDLWYGENFDILSYEKKFGFNINSFLD